MSLPILYSLQHCPYAMRARMALLMSKQEVLLRAVVTKNKPREMLKVSPKGTVPILIFSDESLIDESIDIMIWALKKNDPSDLLYKDLPGLFPKMLELINHSDNQFRTNLSAYKNAKRYHLPEEHQLRSQCEGFIKQLEVLLSKNSFIFGDKLSLADLAILPFIRQFANVDKKWFRDADYPITSLWLANLLQSLLFTKTMQKYPLWLDSQKEYLLNWDQLKL